MLHHTIFSLFSDNGSSELGGKFEKLLDRKNSIPSIYSYPIDILDEIKPEHIFENIESMFLIMSIIFHHQNSSNIPLMRYFLVIISMICRTFIIKIVISLIFGKVIRHALNLFFIKGINYLPVKPSIFNYILL